MSLPGAMIVCFSFLIASSMKPPVGSICKIVGDTRLAASLTLPENGEPVPLFVVLIAGGIDRHDRNPPAGLRCDVGQFRRPALPVEPVAVVLHFHGERTGIEAQTVSHPRILLVAASIEHRVGEGFPHDEQHAEGADPRATLLKEALRLLACPVNVAKFRRKEYRQVSRCPADLENIHAIRPCYQTFAKYGPDDPLGLIVTPPLRAAGHRPAGGPGPDRSATRSR